MGVDMTGVIEQKISGRWTVKVGSMTIDVDASMELLLAQARSEGAQAYADAHPTPAEDKDRLERYAKIIAIVIPDCQPTA
jgi:hypothetical protein